ncbi:hypothetical protein CC78DRAFT_577269 [Lojkania enalia]|uniref:Uncharacterized protein n=1 Tax=Lojkania enalia TaxID=147567 RepID=A0A9P4KEP1_9PLEO|nr:hypothetical protein CC78DRAFT_577269 [Didymosphaeria enalia]
MSDSGGRRSTSDTVKIGGGLVVAARMRGERNERRAWCFYLSLSKIKIASQGELQRKRTKCPRKPLANQRKFAQSVYEPPTPRHTREYLHANTTHRSANNFQRTILSKANLPSLLTSRPSAWEDRHSDELNPRVYDPTNPVDTKQNKENRARDWQDARPSLSPSIPTLTVFHKLYHITSHHITSRHGTARYIRRQHAINISLPLPFFPSSLALIILTTT